MGYIQELRDLVGHRPLIMPGANVIVIDKNSRLLLQLRSDNKCWGLPGGSMELGETLKEVAKRELYEETHLISKNLTLFNIYSGEEFYYKYPHGDEVYKVKSGDTLKSVADFFDISTESIKWLNSMTSDKIKPNQNLKIPPVAGVVHKVKSGDTIYSIAKKYQTEAQNIINFPFNDYSDPDTFALTPGQVLFVPDGIIEDEKPAIAARPRSRQQIAAGQPGTGSFIWPTTGMITQYMSWYHPALDIANRASPPIIAADRGTVVFSGCQKTGYGCHIIVDHGNGYKTLYGHLIRLDVVAGQGVERGQMMGIMGSTGRSTGTHLHFEIRQGDKKLNPLSLLK